MRLFSGTDGVKYEVHLYQLFTYLYWSLGRNAVEIKEMLAEVIY